MLPIGNLYRAARTAGGLSAAELACLAGVTANDLRRIEQRRVAVPDEAATEVVRKLFAAKMVRIDEENNQILMVVDDDDLGRVLAAARVAAGLSQKELAERSRISRRTIAGAESFAGETSFTVRDALTACLFRSGVAIQRLEADANVWVVRIMDVQERAGAVYPTVRGVNDLIVARMRDFDPEVPSLVRLRAEIAGTAPLIWREILIPENASFADLHAALQVSFGWSFRHGPHSFNCGLVVGNPRHEVDPRIVDEREVRLDDVRIREFTYTYGKAFHVITILGHERRAERPCVPIVVDGEGAAIPEGIHPERWNEMAAELRAAAASQDTFAALFVRDLPRNYNPDILNVRDLNRSMVQAGFDIASTIREQIDRDAPRRDKHVTSSEFMDGYPAPPEPSRSIDPSKRLIVVSTGVPSEEEVVRERHRSMEDYQHCARVEYGKRWDRSNGVVMIVREKAVGLAKLLALCSDVKDYDANPIMITWKSSRARGVFIPDFIVDGVVVHVVDSEAEIDAARALASAAGLEITLLQSGFLDDPKVQLALDGYHRRTVGNALPDKSTDPAFSAIAARFGLPSGHAAGDVRVERRSRAAGRAKVSRG